MPPAIEFRVVSLPAATSRLNTICCSIGASGSPSIRAVATTDMMSSPGSSRFCSSSRDP